MNVRQVMAAVRQRGWKVFTRPYELNIVGLRSDSTKPNAFDDHIAVFYTDANGNLASHIYPATTDPGTFWLRQPMNPQGTAILSQGQYLNAYRIGLHRGQYTALVQQGNVTAIRDYDRDAVLDFANGREFTGQFGINIHHAKSSGTTKTVDKYSAGCQVFANFDDFLQFMSLCGTHRQRYGNNFTYTLIDLRAVARTARKRIVVGGLLALTAVGVVFATRQIAIQGIKQQ